jgi:hypothetical protein
MPGGSFFFVASLWSGSRTRVLRFLAEWQRTVLGRSRHALRSHAPVRSAFIGFASHWQIVIWSSKTYWLVLVPGRRLCCFPHARAWRAALRAHQE